jgi:hypothetical protein
VLQKKCPDDCEKETIAIAHDDDLQLIENVVRSSQSPNSSLNLTLTSNVPAQETLTASAVETFLRENQMPVLIENGGIYSTPLQ